MTDACYLAVSRELGWQKGDLVEVTGDEAMQRWSSAPGVGVDRSFPTARLGDPRRGRRGRQADRRPGDTVSFRACHGPPLTAGARGGDAKKPQSNS